MNILLERLYEDHKNMAIVHNILVDQMDLFAQGDEDQDVGLILDILDYLKNYPETFHHALEDRIYATLRSAIQDPELIKMLDLIEMQHAQINVLSKRLQNDFLAITNDQVMSKDRILSDYQAYIDISHDHIVCENKYLLPLVPELLSPYDLDVIKIELDNTADPLFGEERFGVYDNLFHQIVASRQHAA